MRRAGTETGLLLATAMLVERGVYAVLAALVDTLGFCH